METDSQRATYAMIVGQGALSAQKREIGSGKLLPKLASAISLQNVLIRSSNLLLLVLVLLYENFLEAVRKERIPVNNIGLPSIEFIRQ